MDEVLIIGSEFDPSGLTKGLDIGAASLAEFEGMVKQVSRALLGLDTTALHKIAAQRFRITPAKIPSSPSSEQARPG